LNFGRSGEESAWKYLEAKGYELVGKNYRFQRAEIDLIVKKDSEQNLVFVEVKTRRNRKFGEPEEAITQRKIDQLCKSAEGFLLNYPEYNDYIMRFDVISIMIEGKSESIKHFENAF
jgi:putative endonuclease